MSTRQQGQLKYNYRFNLSAEDRPTLGPQEYTEDMQRFVNASLGLLTGGCELCAYARSNNSPALFCEQKKFPVNWGSPRCELFERRSGQAQDPLI